MNRCLLFILLFVFAFSATARAEDPLVGKRVVVIRDKAPLEVSGKEVGKVSECTVFTVTAVEGNFLWIKSQRAYLRRADVVPFEDAIAHYTRLLETNKTANNYWKRAKIWRLKGELDIAIGDMNDAILLNPTESSSFHSRGNLWQNKEEYDKAIADFSEAIRLNPKDGEVYHNRGRAWSNKKDYDKAIADYEEALKHTDPNSKVGTFYDSEITGGDSAAMVNSRAVEFNAVAWLRATCPDEKYRNGPQAVEYATKACELTAWKVGVWLDTLAAAYAEAGDFDKAVEWQQKAMDLASADQKADFETRLKLYQEKKPYRQPVTK